MLYYVHLDKELELEVIPIGQEHLSTPWLEMI